jgi:hypothetical protein
MEIKPIKTILLRDPNGNELRLTLGKIEDMVAYNRFMGSANNDDKGFRWRFVGSKIPIPIRSYEWFNGFPEDTMLSWLTFQGYTVAAVTNHISGYVYVVKGNENHVNKGNESHTKVQLTEEAIRRGEATLKAAVRLLCDQGSVLSAIALYRYVHSCSLLDSKHAVDAIRFDNAI